MANTFIDSGSLFINALCFETHRYYGCVNLEVCSNGTYAGFPVPLGMTTQDFDEAKLPKDKLPLPPHLQGKRRKLSEKIVGRPTTYISGDESMSVKRAKSQYRLDVLSNFMKENSANAIAKFELPEKTII